MNRFNSNLKIHQGICECCKDGKEKPLYDKKRCQFHYKLFREEERRKKSKERMIGEVDKVVGKETDLRMWYTLKMIRSDNKCENCGSRINKQDNKSWHGSQAHVLPKSLFPSVATHPDNHMVLGMYCCHHIYDSNWEAASKMKVFSIAKERFKLFENDIAQDEWRRIPSIFLTDLTITE